LPSGKPGTLRYSRRRLVIGSTLLMLATLLTLLPFMLRQAALAWLHDHGAPQATFRNIDLNLFTGTLAIEGLNSGDGLKIGRLAVDLDWWPLFRGQLDIRSITLDGATLQLDETADGRWLPAGLKLPASTAAPAAPNEPKDSLPLLPVLHSLQLHDIHLVLIGKKLQLSLPLDTIAIRLESLHDDGSQELDVEIATGAARFQGFGYAASDSAVHLQANIDLPPLSPELLSHLNIRKLRMHAGVIELRNAKKQLLGSLQRLNLGNIDLLGGRKLKAGDIHIGDLDLQPALAAGIHLAVGAIVFGKLKADLRQFTAQLASIDANSVMLEHQGLRLARIGNLALNNARLSHGSAEVEKLSVGGAHLQLLRTKAGKIAVLDELAQTFAEPAGETKTAAIDSATASTEQKRSAPSLSVGEITIGKGSRLQFIDRSVTPAFDATLAVDRFSLAPLILPAREASRIDAQFNINEHAILALSGDILPAASPQGKLDLNLKRLDMAELSGYLEQNLGQAVNTGQLDLQSSVGIAGSKINASNTLVIRKLVLKPASEPGKTASLGMPLDMALDMLRDGRGDIRLEVPVTGDLKDPQINLNDAFNQALLTAMQAGAMQYTAQLLQPYGSLITVAKLVGKAAEEASKPRLTPIHFVPQSGDLSDDMRAYSGKIAELLKAKGFRLQVCGVAMRSEAGPDPKAGLVRTLDDEALLKLAGKRSATVIQSLTTQGIDADRLFHCRDQLDAGKKGVPRVELILD